MGTVPVADRSERADACESPGAARAAALAHLETMASLAGGGHDLVHLNTTHFVPFACAAAMPVPVTGTLHCPPYERMAEVLRDQPSVALATVSAANARSWRRHVAVDRVLANGVDLDRWRPGAGGEGAVWVGRLVPEKAPDLAIAAARHAGIPLRLVGPIHDRRYFAQEIEPHLGGGISHVGHVSSADAAALVARADVAVVTPVWDEPFGLVVAEALACGTPVAAIGRGAIRELLTPNVGVIVDDGDPSSLAAALRAARQLDRRACTVSRRSPLRCAPDGRPLRGLVPGRDPAVLCLNARWRVPSVPRTDRGGHARRRGAMMPHSPWRERPRIAGLRRGSLAAVIVVATALRPVRRSLPRRRRAGCRRTRRLPGRAVGHWWRHARRSSTGSGHRGPATPATAGGPRCR